MKRLFIKLCVTVFFVSTACGISANSLSGNPLTTTSVKPDIAGIQIPFIKNSGQTSADIKFYANTFGGTLLVRNNGELVLRVPPVNHTDRYSLISESLVGANVKHIDATVPANTRVSYFRGNNTANWHSNIPSYQVISLGDIYRNIELQLKAGGNNVEKLFHVRPGGNPDDININVTGINKLRLGNEGDLVLDTADGSIVYTRPVAYQMINGKRHDVEVAYTVDNTAYGFVLGEYNHTHELVIDPLIRTSYMGGSAIEYIYNLAVHPVSGDVYVIGETTSTDFPDTTGATQETSAGAEDVFVARFNENLTALKQVSYLGGTGKDQGFAVAFHSSTSDVYVTGTMASSDFPVTTSSYNGGRDMFIARLSEDLTTLQQSLYKGTGFNDGGSAIIFRTDPATPTSGELYVAGHYGQPGSGFPDAIVLRLSDGLTELGNVTIGGTGNDYGQDLAIDSGTNTTDLSDDKIYLVGIAGYNPQGAVYPYVSYSDFPTTLGAAQTGFGGQEDVFIARFNNTLTTTETATFLGSAGIDRGYGIEVDTSGASPIVYVTGYFSYDATNTLVFTGGAQETHAGSHDGFVARLDADLSNILAGSYFGGSATDRAYGLQLGTAGDVYIAGVTNSSDLPGTTGGAQPDYGSGFYDAFVARFSADLSSIGQATYFGGSGMDESWWGLALHPGNGNLYLAGDTESDDLAATSGAPYASNAGSMDGFITTMDADLKGEAAADVSIDKTGSTTIALNASLSYTLTVNNAGPDDATSVHVRDKLPEGVSVTSATPTAGSCTVYGPGLVPDQEFDPSTLPTGTTEQHSAISNVNHKAQTFTVDLGGTLDEVSIYIYRTDPAVSEPLLVDVRATDASGVPLESDTNVLASAVINAIDAPAFPGGFVSVDVSTANIDVADGDVLAIVLRTENVDAATASPYMWFGAGSKNLYADGKPFVRTPTYPTWTATETTQATVPDLGFNSTVTTSYSVVECDLGTVASGATTTVTIDGTAPGVDQYMVNQAAVSAAETDPDTGNNADSLTTMVGSPVPDIAVSPTSFDYGGVTISTTSAYQHFTISNTGNWKLIVDSISNSNPTDFIAVVSGGGATCSPIRPFELAPGQSCDITVAFSPSASGVRTANITIVSDDPDENPVIIPLTGNGTSLGDIDVIPTSITFPNTVVGERIELGIGISNTGSGDLTITSIAKTETASPTNFIVVVSGGNATCSASSPFTLASGASCIITVTFAPQTTGDHTASVTITSDDSDEGSITVPVNGTGVTSSGGGGGGLLMINPASIMIMLVYFGVCGRYLRKQKFNNGN